MSLVDSMKRNGYESKYITHRVWSNYRTNELKPLNDFALDV